MSDQSSDLDTEALSYQWHAGYDRDNEYVDSPRWASETESEVATARDIDGDVWRFYDVYDPEHIWMRSDTVYDLTNTL